MRCDCALSRLPPAVNGVALGCAGLATVAATCADLGLVPRAAALQDVLLSVTLAVVCAYIVKTITAPRAVLAELLHPRRCPGLGAFSMCLMFVAAWAEGGQEGAFGLALLSVATVLAAVVGACHWLQSVRLRLPLEPTAFPADVSLGLVPIVGSKVGMLPAARDAAFWLAFANAVVITPPVVFRLARSRQPANPGIWPLCAPWALLAAAWHASDGGRSTPEAFGVSLSIFSILMLGLTFVFAALRARAIARTFFSPAWANFTFPTCTCSVATLRLAHRVSSPALLVLGGCLGVAAATVVLTVLALTIVHLPAWLQGRERPCSGGGGVAGDGGGEGSSSSQGSAPRPGADSDQRRILPSSSSPSDSPVPAASGAATGVEYV